MKFDREYSTSLIKEKDILEKNGIMYSFVKKVDGVTIYKYKKTYTLFRILSQLYWEEYFGK